MTAKPQKILLIQTAFLGDVVLATSAVESVRAAHPGAEIHFLLRKGNESLLSGNPQLSRVWVLDKSKKWRNVRNMISSIRKEKFDLVINFQRFATSGILTAFSGGRELRGFRKNPMSFLFTSRYSHVINPEGSLHEIERNHALFSDLAPELKRPRLYPQKSHYDELPDKEGPYICVAPASVWFTKQWPAEKWSEFLNAIDKPFTVYLLGAPGDKAVAEKVMAGVNNKLIRMHDLTGKLSLLGSAALMENARMNYVNDSAPLHLASAMNAPVTAVFCSTVPGFGFTPLSDQSRVVEISEPLDCRPCGLHGHAACPEGHFKCALKIETRQLMHSLA